MKPIQSKQRNVIIAKDQPQYQPIPAHRAHDECDTVIFCWQLTEEEKQRVMETGVIWHSSMTFGHAFQPQLLSVESPFIFEEDDSEKDS